MRRITQAPLPLLTIQTHTYVGVPATSVWTFASAEIQQSTESWETHTMYSKSVTTHFCKRVWFYLICQF